MRKGVTTMWEIAFGIICLGIAVLNIGYCLFDHE